ncbi:unnamed protein product, partial [Gulo gulo]
VVWHNCSSFLVKQSKQIHSTKPNNPKASNSFLYKELIHLQAVGIDRVEGSQAKVQWWSRSRDPAGSYVWTTIHENARATFCSIMRMIHVNMDCPYLLMVAICIHSAILRSQKPVMVRRKQSAPTTAPEHRPPAPRQ